MRWYHFYWIWSLLLAQSQLLQAQDMSSVVVGGMTSFRVAFSKSSDLAEKAQSEWDAGQFAAAYADAKRSQSIGHGGCGVPDLIIASVLNEQGKTADALKAYQMLGGDDPYYLLPYSLLLLKNRDWPKAVTAYETALPHVGSDLPSGNQFLTEESNYSPNDPQPLDLETDIHIAMGFSGIDDIGREGKSSRLRGLAEYQEALKLEPDSALANLAYASGLREVGREAEAVAQYKIVASKYAGDIHDSAEEELGHYPQPASQSAPSLQH